MKSILKRSLCLLTAILTLCVSASAVSPQEAADLSEITPRYAYIRNVQVVGQQRRGIKQFGWSNYEKQFFSYIVISLFISSRV